MLLQSYIQNCQRSLISSLAVAIDVLPPPPEMTDVVYSVESRAEIHELFKAEIYEALEELAESAVC